MSEEYLDKAEIAAALAVFAERHDGKKITCGVTTFVKRLEEFIYNLPAAPARKIITKPFRVYFRGIHTSWALCPTCSSRFMFPNSKPYTVCPYCGTVRKLEDRKEEPNE